MMYQVEAKEWRDKANGNSYFSARITDENGAIIAKIPFQYGYGDTYIFEAKDKLAELGLMRTQLFSAKQEKCTKREVIEWGE